MGVPHSNEPDEKDFDRGKYGEKVCIHMTLLSIFLAIIKFIAGILGNSIALIADAFHSLTDVITTIFVIISLRISQKPPDHDHPYGHGKIESIVAKIISLVLIGLGVLMMYVAISTIVSGNISTPTGIAVWVVIISILLKEFSYRYTLKAAKKIRSAALEADAWHHRTDAFSSIAVLIGVVGAMFGFPILDPIAAILVSLFIIWAGYKLLKGSIDELMDRLPSEDILKSIEESCSGIQGVRAVRNIKIRKYGAFLTIDCVIVVDPLITVQEGHQLATLSKQRIIENNDSVKEVFVHVSPNENKPEQDTPSKGEQ